MNFGGKDHMEGNTFTSTDYASGDIGEKWGYEQGSRLTHLTLHDFSQRIYGALETFVPSSIFLSRSFMC